MSLFKRSALVAAVVGGLTLALAAPASAHVTVNPNTATPGGYTKVTFRVPNEKDSANTTKLEVNLPAGQPVASVSIKPLPGWTAVADKTKLATPIKSDDGDITEAVTKITWTADASSAIKPGQFQEFDVSLGPLPESGQMVFKALQTYSDGDIVRWIDDPTTDGTEPEHPAPVLKLTAATAPAAAAPAATGSADSDGPDAFAVAGFVAGLLGLILALLAFQRSARKPAAASDSSSSSAADDKKVPTGA
ncbi:YcnI family protein [Actinoplanes sp. KI2]|uniref:YcnI family copper-binding membrane protein n=1 Tax=Actinoplanes sp. KI2 TaxID=2983315 RepID=UPI0021D58BFB|nr:YcnI family protein [Actinoplanes sp. KI2]MCU7728636.1 YcnI family protein [Actinoplanes sp. KI2]